MPERTAELWKEYQIAEGNACPVCGSPRIRTDGTVRSSDLQAWQDMACETCGSLWRDLYTMTGIDLI